MIRLSGREVADAITADLIKRIGALKEKGIEPRLAILRVGQREDDLAYERGVLKRFEVTGTAVDVNVLDEGVSQEELDSTFDRLNNDPLVHGILVLRPLPEGLSDEHMRKTIDPGKDVDFMDVRNLANVLAGVPGCSAPCTAEAVMEMIRYYKIETKGRKVTVVGRSLVIGKPVALLLTTANATVTVCHTKTQNVAEECKRADIIVACCGVAKIISERYVKPDQIVIDVGMNVDDSGRLCGDVDYEKVSRIAGAVSPVPGGVGSITTAILLKHVVINAERQA
ncbi:MAG: bifunctional 5,10-methylenetetrahydrofolate dehydrogenase/5,10-methenyltetrahydrofolate cyclohydrolase [Lachnospiraceae bacterium]|nr:bifunctional 5,10-methylenetetrahydrofolate dehydrogenase/5,10-methenyltetrahydrofolate cyclohydrolase [Lachnospiraceae bacterium]